MSFIKSVLVAGLVSVAAAYTPPGAQTYGALLTPNLSDSVTQGQSFQVTWDNTGHSTDGVTVSLVLCKGPGSNCVLQPSAIVEGVPAAQASYTWAVPCSLTPGVQSTNTGYGMLIIVDGTGEFQYSTQFSVNASPACSASSSSSSSAASSSSSAAASSSSSAAASSSQSASSSISSASSTASESSSASHASSKQSTTASGQSTGASTMATMHTTTTGSANGASATSAQASASASSTQFKGSASKVNGGIMSWFAAGILAVLAF